MPRERTREKMPSHGLWTSPVIGPRRDAHGGGNLREPVRHRIPVELHDPGKEDGVGDAVGYAVPPAQGIERWTATVLEEAMHMPP